MKIWHPFTQEKTEALPIKIAEGKGQYLFDDQGNRYIDMVSSWWVNILGHSNEEIADAIHHQAKVLEHVIFAGFTHAPAEELCSRLYNLLPPSLEYFFFSDNGSTAVEVALKMAYQYFKNVGETGRNIYINLEGGYHGDTLGAMSAAGSSSQYHSTFSEFFFRTFSIDFPDDCESEERALEKLREFLKGNGQHVCALIIEPLIQGAAGMRVYSHQFLEQIVREVRRHGIIVIFDEVMTGFYRTGTMFAMDQCSEKPDMICLSKAITGGFLPLALTVTNKRIYDAFFSDDPCKTFTHGHSYTANPISCAAACKTLEILQRPETQLSIRQISETHIEYLPQLSHAINRRSIGTIAAFDVPTPQLAQCIKEKMIRSGIIIRPIGSSIYLIPPYCITRGDLEWVYMELVAFPEF
ncbi:MAG: adenosylmethionine--8-amino-7-oxononanoate transaminase [Holosporales bacterium]|jgi:adenosylmethionine-8-amino-7-oxononanoate aminotransferase|nr:adenosylmethionine--8-amino-7-oxononanoate transaminase [Holosporales bacterium]